MKKKCKNIDITNWQTVMPWVRECILRHKKRYDFKALLLKYGVTETDYYLALESYDYDIFESAIEAISKEACRRIVERDLQLSPVCIRRKVDTTTGKIRDIGKESAMQQVFDHIAVYSAMDIFTARIADQQMSSIPGRGQIKGVNLIKKYVIADNKAMAYAKRHEMRYTSKCKHHAKLDVKQCYPNAKVEVFMRLFEHDCGNDDIIWLWWALLTSHHVHGYKGFMIGAWVSQWACQFMLSFIYHKAMTLTYERRGVKHKKISHMVMFMDDMALFGSNRRQLLSAIRELIEYAKMELGFTIKSNFAIHNFDDTGLDMMGFVIYRNGKVEMRERNFIKSRRLILRFMRTGRLVYSQAQRLNSYKGFYKYSDSRKVTRQLKVRKIFRLCSLVISEHDKEKHHAENLFFSGTRKNFIPASV